MFTKVLQDKTKTFFLFMIADFTAGEEENV
jgi:hypothetical protein